MDGFLELVEFAIALAGFTSVVVVFAQKERVWQAFDKFRIGNALMASLGAAFLAAVPIGLEYLALEEQIIWETEALLVAFYFLFLVSAVIFRSKKMLTHHERAQMPRIVVGLILLFSLGFSVTLLFGVAGMHELPLKGLSYFGIVYMILVSVFAFTRMIFYKPKEG